MEEKLTLKEFEKIMVNPFYCINISPDLSVDHQTMITREEWVKANTKLIKEIGIEKFLNHLLDVLEGDFV